MQVQVLFPAHIRMRNHPDFFFVLTLSCINGIVLISAEEAVKMDNTKGMPQVRIVRINPFRAVTSGKDIFDRVMGEFNAWQEAHEDLIRPMMYGAPDFLWSEEDGQAVWIWAVKENVEAADTAPYELIDFEGGLYATAVAVDGDDESNQRVYNGIKKWIDESGFVVDERAERRTMCHMLNPSEELHRVLGYDQLEIYVPIRIK